jgi:MerR family transcriptional regulator, heat shock protein HspR
VDAGSRFVVTVTGAARLVRDDEPLYVISVAAEVAGMHPQTLRQYDRLGLVSPGRAGGGSRRYSLRDIQLLREIQRLSHEEGVNLAGIKRILDLEGELDAVRERLAELSAEYSWLAAKVAPHTLARFEPRRMIT